MSELEPSIQIHINNVIKDDYVTIESKREVVRNLMLRSIAISLKRIADRLDRNSEPLDKLKEQSLQPSDSIFQMMYQNRDPKEHSSRDDLK